MYNSKNNNNNKRLHRVFGARNDNCVWTKHQKSPFVCLSKKVDFIGQIWYLHAK